MNNLTLDQIGFIKRKIEQFIVLPESPRKQPSPQTPNPRRVDNSKNNIKRSSSNQKQAGNRQKNINAVRQRSVSGDKKNMSQRISGNVALSPQSRRQVRQNQSSNQSKNWLKKKESEIVKFINHENRNKQSVLNKFLNSEKLHLKKREDVDEKYAQQKQNQHRDEAEKNGPSKSFSFDNEFTQLKKVYKNLGSLFALNEVQENKQSTPNNDLMISKEEKSGNNHESTDQKKNPAGIFDFLKHFSGQKQPSKQTYVVQTGQSLVKPSALKGKMFQGKKQEAGKPNNMIEDKNQGKPANLFQLFGKEKEVPRDERNMQVSIKQKEKEVVKSRSQVSLDRMKMSGSASIGKNAKGEKHIKERERHNSISRKERFMKGASNSQSKNSFEPYFDSERPSSIRQKRYMNSNKDMSQQKSRFLNEEFPYWVYRRSAKENSYEMTKEQKFFQNKYSTKQIAEGDSDKTVLKQKYQLLDQRLQRLLESVKRQDQPTVKPQPNEDQSYISVVNQVKCEVPQQILTYQRLSPLKKLVKINNQLKLKFNSSTF